MDHARSDTRVTGAALTGSAAANREDRWSDIDLAFGIAEGVEIPPVLSDWTAHLYDRHHAVHHTDITFGQWVYRVFLLPGTLQVDLAFAPASEFRPLAPSFRLLFGAAQDALHVPLPAPASLIGLGWLYALHARTAIARRLSWQAEYMISGVRDHTLTLACLRHGLPAAHAKGVDQLPPEVTAPFAGTLVRRLDFDELARAFRTVVPLFLDEIRHADPALAGRLQQPLQLLIESAQP